MQRRTADRPPSPRHRRLRRLAIGLFMLPVSACAAGLLHTSPASAAPDDGGGDPAPGDGGGAPEPPPDAAPVDSDGVPPTTDAPDPVSTEPSTVDGAPDTAPESSADDTASGTASDDSTSDTASETASETASDDGDGTEDSDEATSDSSLDDDRSDTGDSTTDEVIGGEASDDDPDDPDDPALAYPEYELTDRPEQVEATLQTAVTAAAVVGAAAAGAAAAGAAGAAGSSGRTRPGRSGGRGRSEGGSGSAGGTEGEYAEVYAGDAAFVATSAVAIGAGDRSRSWKAPLTTSVDGLSLNVPHRVARWSPLVAGMIADGTWLRAIFGSAATVVPAVGIALGVGAGIDANGSFLPPAMAWVLALTVVGLLDALAGAAAAIAYAVVTIALGGLPTLSEGRALGGLVVLWFAPALLAAATRPLRRERESGLDHWLDRSLDVVFAPMMAAWCALAFAYGQNALTGRELPIAARYATVAWVVFATLAGRYLVETTLPYLYPVRLSETDAGEPDTPSRTQRLISLALRVATYVVVADAFFPVSWQVAFATGALAFSIFGYWEEFAERLPNSSRMHRWMPVGLPLAVLILFSTEKAALWFAERSEDPSRRLLNTFAYVAVPLFVTTAIAAVGREGDRPPLERWHRVVAVPLLALAAHYMFGWFTWIPI